MTTDSDGGGGAADEADGSAVEQLETAAGEQGSVSAKAPEAKGGEAPLFEYGVD